MHAIFRPKSATPSLGRLLWFALAASALPLSGCTIDGGAPDPAAYDYHARYPIVVAKAPTTLEVFAHDGPLDKETTASLAAFADRYKQFGAGRIAILSPSNQRRGAVVAAIRKALYDAGVRGSVAVGSYPNAETALAAPVRVAYLALKATVQASCGNFPSDLASGDDLKEWNNTPYENFGCATQKMIAAQIDDPRDVDGARASTEADVEMRLRAIDDVRKGTDPGTAWKVQNTAIGQVGGS